MAICCLRCCVPLLLGANVNCAALTDCLMSVMFVQRVSITFERFNAGCLLKSRDRR